MADETRPESTALVPSESSSPDGPNRASPRASRLPVWRDAWRETRRVLADFEREASGADPMRQHPPFQRALAKLRAAAATEPAWLRHESAHEDARPAVEGFDVLGDAPAGAPSERQLREAERGASRLERELQRARELLREAQRTTARQAVAFVAESTEAGLTAILRPLARTVATATEPMQRGFGGTGAVVLGLGLVWLLFR